jgi:hypothetical protein
MNRWVVATAALLVGISGACSARTPTGRWENPAELTWQKTWGVWSDTMYARGRTLDAAIASLRASAGQTPTSDALHRSKVGETQPLPIVVKTPASTDVSYTSPTLNRVAGVLARKRMTVHCWSVADWRSLGREVRALRLGKFDSDTIGWAEVRGTGSSSHLQSVGSSACCYEASCIPMTFSRAKLS